MSTTTYLEIEDQANGSNNNSWGDVADSNFQILEQAIARSLSLATTGGSTTLTSSQNRYTIKKDGGQAIAVGDIARTGQKLLLCYDKSSTTWELLNPANVASDTTSGMVRLATIAEVKAGTDDSTAVTPEALAALTNEGSNIAAAATITIGDGRHFALTGNTTVTAISITNDAAGREVTLRLTANAVLQNNANILSPTGADLQGHAGMLVTCKSDGAGVVRIIDVQTSPGASRAPDVIVEDQKSSGTEGGTFTSGADRTRDLNTLVRNAATVASVAGNKVTFPRGNWYLEFEAPAFGVDAHQAILYNATTAADIARGSSEYSNNGTTVTTTSRGSAFVTFSANTDVEIHHRCTSTKASQGFGRAGSFGTEVYARLKAWRCP